MKKCAFLFLFICSSLSVFTQTERTDSLKRAIPAMGEDTNKVNAILDLAQSIFRTQPDSAIYFAQMAIDLATNLNYKKGLGYALKNMGLANYIKSDFVEVLNYWEQSLAIFTEIDDKLGISNLNNNIGAVHFAYGDDPKALEYYLESLKAAEEMGHKLRIATALQNIGAVYQNKRSTFDKALENYLRALPLTEEIGNLSAIGTVSVNLGEIYRKKGDPQKALDYFQKALQAFEKSGGNLAYTYINIGLVYSDLGKYDQAIRFHEKAIEITKKIDSKHQLVQAQNGLAHTYYQKGDFNKSVATYNNSEAIAIEIGLNMELRDIYEGLSKSYSSLSDYKKAFDNQVLFNNIRDTIDNIEVNERIANLEFQFDLEKKEAEIELLRKDNDLNEATIERANILRNFLFAVAGFLVLFLGGIIYQYTFARKSNKIISEERNRAESILLNILPEETAHELKEKGFVEAKRIEEATVLFTDFKDFTKAAEANSAEELVKTIDYYFTKFDEIVTNHHLEKIKTIGDAYMCAGGLPIPNKTHAKDAVKAAIEIVEFVKQTRVRKPEGILPLDIRVGLNTGPVIAGVVGTKKFQYDIWGSTVNIASRMESSSVPGRINISESTYKLVKEEFPCEFRGELKAKYGESFKMYFVGQTVQKTADVEV